MGGEERAVGGEELMEEIREELREEIEDLAEYLEEEEEEDEEEREAREAREARMLRDNPWWEHPAAIDADPDIVKWEASRVRREPPLLGRMRLGTWPAGAAILVLGGPRGAGKTTLVKLQVRALLRGGDRSPERLLLRAGRGRGRGGADPRAGGVRAPPRGAPRREGQEVRVPGRGHVRPGMAGRSGGAGGRDAAARLHRRGRRLGAGRGRRAPRGASPAAPGGGTARPATRCGPWGSPSSPRCATARSARAWGELRGDAARGMLLAGGIPEGARGLRGAFSGRGWTLCWGSTWRRGGSRA